MHPEAVVLKFLDAVDADLAHGELAALEEYQRRFPEHADLIRDEYGRLVADGAAHGGDGPRTIGGRYRVLESLGRGGFGEVLLAEDLQLARRVALKVLAGVRAFGHEWRARLVREAEAANHVGDDGICPVHDVGFANGAPFLVMPWIPGRSLDRVVAASAAHGEGPAHLGAGDERARQRRDACLLLIERVARTLQRAHAAGVVHRDVKPANILVRPDGRPVLIDFGLAWMQSGDEGLTRSGALGTPAYAAPEVLRGSGARDPRVDVWSLGAVLYETLTLRRPFVARPDSSLERTVLEAPVPRLGRAFGKDLQAVLETALARRPGERYATMAAFADDLARVRRNEPVAVRAAGPLRRLFAWLRARPRAVGFTVAGLAAVVAAGVALATQWARAHERAVVADAVTALAASMDDVVRDSERLARFGFAIEDRAAQAEALLTTVRRLRGGVGSDDYLDRCLARVLRTAGGLHLQLGAVDPATAELLEAQQLLESLCARANRADDRTALAHTLVLLGDAQGHVDDLDGALAKYRAAFALDAELLAAAPDDATRRSNVGFGHLRIGFMLQRLRRFDAALAEQREAVRRLREAAARDAGNPARIVHTAEAVLELCRTMRAAGRPAEEVRAALDEIEPQVLRYAEQNPLDSQAWQALNRASSSRLELAEDRDERLRLSELLVARARRFAQLEPQSPYGMSSLCLALCTRATTLADDGQLPAAIEASDEALALAERALAINPEVAAFVRDQVSALTIAADVQRRAGDPGRARRSSDALLAFVATVWRRTATGTALRVHLGRALLAPDVAAAGGRERLLELLAELPAQPPPDPALLELAQHARRP